MMGAIGARAAWGVAGGVLVGAAALFAARPASSQPKSGGKGASDYNLAGSYEIHGATADGKQYTGTAGIVKIGGEMYKGTWTTGGTTTQGICFRDGDILSCGWSEKNDLGVMAYLVGDDNSLDGVWFEENHTKLGKEFLVGGNDNLLGTYTIKNGETPEKVKYTGTVDITIKNGVYKLKWTQGKHKFNGLGLRNGDVLTAAFNDTGKFGVLQYRVKKGGKFLTGQWATESSTGPGIESLEKKF